MEEGAEAEAALRWLWTASNLQRHQGMDAFARENVTRTAPASPMAAVVSAGQGAHD